VIVPYEGPVIDCDVHHEWPTPWDLVPYLSTGWQEYVTGPGRLHKDNSLIPMMPVQLCPNPTGLARHETFPPDGGAPGSNYELLRDQLLDPCRIERALLVFGLGEFVGALPNPYFAAEIARAANDWSIDNWLNRDDKRLYGAALLATQLPDVAAAEVRRVGEHPRIAEVLLVSSGVGKPFGHPLYHPIYEAAAELDLPIAIHVGGEAFPGIGVSPIAGGMPNFYFESHPLGAQGMMTHLTSFISHGVFEKFPDLRLLLVETEGVAWVPWLLWALDERFRALRREIPWVKKLPSEYFREHVRLTTQPLDRSPEPEQLIEILAMFGGEDVLLFSTDYPHWDADEVDYITSRLPESWLPKVFRENAIEFFRWTDLPAAPASEPARIGA
jgi:predicted TIM-barrel fold metal-dependent hydrolase